MKLPKLFTHFQHHANEHKDIKNFFDFLHKHYSDHHEKDSHSKDHNGEDNDCDLPFKHCGNCCVNVHAPTVGFLCSSLDPNFSCVVLKSSVFIPENDRFQSNDLHSIWQPPKLA